MKKIIVVVGMCGVGKSVISDYIEKKGYKRIYFGAITFDKLKEENIVANPETERMMREKLREVYGMGAFATLNLPKIKEALKTSNVLVESLYSWDELKILQEEFTNIVVIAVIADKKLRYQRLSERLVRPFSETEAIKRDITEIENIAKAGPIAYADYFIDNNGTIEELYEQTDRVLKVIENEE